MFANPNHPTVEYHYRPDGTRPYSHCEDRDLFRVITVEGDCVYYLGKKYVFRLAHRRVPFGSHCCGHDHRSFGPESPVLS